MIRRKGKKDTDRFRETTDAVKLQIERSDITTVAVSLLNNELKYIDSLICKQFLNKRISYWSSMCRHLRNLTPARYTALCVLAQIGMQWAEDNKTGQISCRTVKIGQVKSKCTILKSPVVNTKFCIFRSHCQYRVFLFFIPFFTHWCLSNISCDFL